MENHPLSGSREAQNLPPSYRGPRADILLELKRAPGLTARDLGDRLGLSLNAVRHHLKELEAEQVIEYRREQRGVGAPAFAYLLTPAGEGLFPRRYEALVTEVLARLQDPAGRSALLDAVEARYAALARRLEAELADAPAEERVARVTRILTDEGYMAEWAQAGDRLTLREHNCAIHAAAEQVPEICDAEARFLSQVLGGQVERRSHILTGCGSCEYSIHIPGAPSAPVPIGRRGPAASSGSGPGPVA